MQPFPKSIESHLRAAGFSTTEILILRHLSEGGAYTLRQLASRMGKSTGVLDQAIQKLLLRRILRRVHINGTPSYVLSSCDAMAHWVQEYTREELLVLRRKEQDIHHFFASIALCQDRPQLTFFDAAQGIQQAYRQLLRDASSEILAFLPGGRKTKPALSFWQSVWVMERRRHGIGCRALAPDTPAGRRLHSRDELEERVTRLVPSADSASRIAFYVAGEAVTCVDEERAQVCRFHFPHFAASQRALFESMWQAHAAPGVGLRMRIDMIPLSVLEQNLQ